MYEWITPLIASSALWLKLGWCIEQPTQQIAIPEQMLHNCVAACLEHARYNARDLHGDRARLLSTAAHQAYSYLCRDTSS